MERREELISLFKNFAEKCLIEHDIDNISCLLSDDIIGIGMGSQGIVSCKKDAVEILSAEKRDGEKQKTSVEYENIQVRCFDESYAIVCGVLKIGAFVEGKQVVTSLGQMMNFRKEAGKWIICALQATPLFNAIEEMEAYPIKFAENVLEKYRQQEQIAQNAQSDSIAIYRIDFTEGVFKDAVLKDKYMIPAEEGESYELKVFESARRYLNEEESYQFIKTFSLGNVLKAYHTGKTEVEQEYMASFRPGVWNWYKTVIKLYVDKADEHLKGYLYVSDINEEKGKEIELQRRAELDPLTGLFNKQSVQFKIQEKLSKVSAHNKAAFFMLDLDHFKEVNDNYGHIEGDRVLREAS